MLRTEVKLRRPQWLARSSFSTNIWKLAVGKSKWLLVDYTNITMWPTARTWRHRVEPAKVSALADSKAHVVVAGETHMLSKEEVDMIQYLSKRKRWTMISEEAERSENSPNGSHGSVLMMIRSCLATILPEGAVSLPSGGFRVSESAFWTASFINIRGSMVALNGIYCRGGVCNCEGRQMFMQIASFTQNGNSQAGCRFWIATCTPRTRSRELAGKLITL